MSSLGGHYPKPQQPAPPNPSQNSQNSETLKTLQNLKTAHDFLRNGVVVSRKCPAKELPLSSKSAFVLKNHLRARIAAPIAGVWGLPLRASFIRTQGIQTKLVHCVQGSCPPDGLGSPPGPCRWRAHELWPWQRLPSSWHFTPTTELCKSCKSRRTTPSHAGALFCSCDANESCKEPLHETASTGGNARTVEQQREAVRFAR